MQPASNAHIRTGQVIRQGEVIGNFGGSGRFNPNEFAPHLQYELWDRFGQRIVPYNIQQELINLPKR